MAVTYRPLETGEVLFEEGDPGAEMFVISSGSIRITKHLDDEPDRVLADLGSGEFFGEMAILNQEPRNATATATEDSLVMVYDRSTFEDLLYSNPSIAVRMVYKMAERLRRADAMVR